jgi:hypothetical protein
MDRVPGRLDLLQASGGENKAKMCTMGLNFAIGMAGLLA